MPSKKCNACQETKDLNTEEFGKLSRSIDGYTQSCRTCLRKKQKIYDKTYNLRHPGRNSEATKKWKDKNKDYVKQFHKAYHARKKEENPELIFQTSRNRWLKRKYGIDTEHYNKLLETQNYLCAICQ